MKYYDWLVNKISPDEYSRNCYQKILSLLFSTKFISLVEHDENRAIDGLELRNMYYKDTGFSANKFGDCSVLEVLIGLAIRWDDDLLYDPEDGERVNVWFWEMMENLGLTCQDDYRFDEDYSRRVIERFLNRKYLPNGRGGAFPVDSFSGDMRKIELWYQLNQYVLSQFYA